MVTRVTVPYGGEFVLPTVVTAVRFLVMATVAQGYGRCVELPVMDYASLVCSLSMV